MTHRMDGKVPPSIIERALKIPSKAWKKNYKCKKLKGDHEFRVAIIKHASWNILQDGTWEKPHSIWSNKAMPYWVEWHCRGCGKHEYEWSALKKKLDKFRKTIWENAA